MVRSCLQIFVGIACLLVLGTSPARAESIPAARIVGGSAVDTCAWPSTVGFGYCTGTLIHPRVVVSAAHCLHEERATQVHFGETIDAPARSVDVEYCESYSGFDDNFGDGVDWAYCVLREAVVDVPIVPPLMGCEARVLDDPEAMATLVGFGRDDERETGVKRAVEVPIRKVAGGEAVLGGNGKAGCFGDSGGPAFVQVQDGSWRVFGIISYALGACGSSEHVSLLADAMGWIEKQLAVRGIDLTPCTNADGDWLPDGRCENFPVAADVGEGDWSEGCAESVAIGSVDSCGPAFDPSNPPTEPIPNPIPKQADAHDDHDAPASDGASDEWVHESGCSMAPRSTPRGLWGMILFGLFGVYRARGTSV